MVDAPSNPPDVRRELPDRSDGIGDKGPMLFLPEKNTAPFVKLTSLTPSAVSRKGDTRTYRP